MGYLLKYLFRFFLLIIFVASCKTSQVINEAAIFGHYRLKQMYEVNADISLYPDNSFKHCWYQGLMYGETSGVWKIQNNLLVLNSERQNAEKETFKIKRNIVTDTAFYKLEIVDDQNEPMLGVNCVFSYESNFGGGTSSDIHGIINIPVQLKFDKLIFSHLGYNDIEVLKSELLGTSSVITLLDFADHYRFFINEKWKIKYGRLIDPGIKLGRYSKRNYYEKLLE